MSTEHSQPINRPTNRQIVEEAAEWLVELNTGEMDPDARQKFDAWLRASPEHVRAYLELLPLWEDGATRVSSEDAGPDALITWARNADNIVPLSEAARSEAVSGSPVTGRHRPKSGTELSSRGPAERFLSRRRFAIAASVAITCAALGVLTWVRVNRDSTYATDIGEHRSIALADGSTVAMNTRSKIRIRFTNTQRTVDLLQGQALFSVAKDHTRPFIVESDDTRVRAVGTQFDVYRKQSGTTVTVLEGRVAVVREPLKTPMGSAPVIAEHSAASESRNADPSLAGAIFLSPGEQVTVTAVAASQPTRANLAAATAWTQRRLVFDATTLAEVVEEFNRYNKRPLVLRDGALETFPITAAFSSIDPASLVRFLETQPGIIVTATDDEIQISATP